MRGGNKTADITAYIEELFKTCLGNATLRQIIITHNHEDHTNYVKDVKEWAKAYEQGELSSVQNPFHLSSRVISKQYELKLVQIKTIKGFEGISSIFDMFPIHDTDLSFLYPLTVLQANSKNKEAIRRYENHRSSVFVLTYQGIKVLFTGDATGLSLDNYVEKHEGGYNIRVNANRELLKNIHLFVMPHHGSFEDDSFRWAFYVTKHSSRLLASVICEDPFVSNYRGLQTGIRDFPWPMSMRNANITNYLYYWSINPSGTGRANKYDLHKKQTNAALFMTGAEPCRCVYFMILEKCLYKYDSKKQDFVHLNGTGVTFNDPYEDNNEIVDSVVEVEEDENTTGGMMQMITSSSGGNRSTQKMKKMEEDEISGIGQVTEQKEMKEKKSDSDGISEDEFTFINPHNVYKFQDAFDGDNDHMAYAS